MAGFVKVLYFEYYYFRIVEFCDTIRRILRFGNSGTEDNFVPAL